MNIAPGQEALIIAAVRTTDDELRKLEEERDALSSIPSETRSRSEQNRLVYVDWTLDRISRGRELLGADNLARLRVETELRKALDEFYEVCAALGPDRGASRSRETGSV